MVNKRTSLIQKCISNGFSLTPIEIIHLKYLLDKESSDNQINNEMILNPYLERERKEGAIPHFQLVVLERRAKTEFPELYRSVSYVYKNFWDQNTHLIGDCYKGIALITQFRYMWREYLDQSPFDNNFSKQKQKDILSLIDEFTTYSYVHEKEVSLVEVTESLRLTFTKLLIGIINVLILNCYLTKIIDTDEIILFNFLETLYENKNGLQLYFDKKKINSIIESNHKKYLENISHILVNVPNGFSDNSLEYVKDTICERINFDS